MNVLEFYSTKLINIILNPLNFFFILFFFLILCIFFNRTKLKKLSFFLFLYAIFIGYVPLSYVIISKIENYYKTIDVLNENFDGLIVMGGAFNAGVITKERQDISLNDASERLFKAIEILKVKPNLIIVHTGFSGELNTSGWNESEMAKLFFLKQGLNLQNFIFEDKSRNTFENAMYTSKILKKHKEKKWGLITSAIHMPRSMLAFKKNSIILHPIPTDYISGTSNIPWFSFSLVNGFNNWSKIIHEVVGIVYYKIRYKFQKI